MRPHVAPPLSSRCLVCAHNCTHSNQLPICDHRYSNSHKHVLTVVSFCLTAALGSSQRGRPTAWLPYNTARTVVGCRIGVSPLIAGFQLQLHRTQPLPTRETRDWHGSGVVTGGKIPSKNNFLPDIFFLPEPVACRRVYGLEAYSRTSRESNHHRQSVSAVKNDALPTEPRGHPKTISFRRPGSVETTYDFTLIEYKLHIDETPWTIYSTLVNALETEFFEEF